MYQPGAGAEDEPVGQVRSLALLSHGDSSWSQQGTEQWYLWGWMLDHVPPPCFPLWAPTGQAQTSQGVQVPWALLLCSSSLSPRSGGHFMSTAEKIRLPDDCTIGYIIESVLGVKLIRSNLLHSHLENLHQVPKTEIHKQVSLS